MVAPVPPQVTSMVATGPRPPISMGNGGGDEPLKITIGEGMMGECRAI